jgi:biopolymer transport protein ExbB
MKSITLLFSALLIVLLAPAGVRADKELLQLLHQAESLRKEYARQQAQLQRVTEKRWSARQKQVAAKERNKEGADQVRQEIERLYSDVARAREVLLARENALESERQVLRQKKQDWDYVSQAVTEKLEKEAEANLRGFPLGREVRMMELTQIERNLAGAGNPVEKLNALIQYKIHNIRSSATIGLGKRTFVLGKDEPITAQVLRVSNAMAYAMDSEGTPYYLTASSKGGGQNPFEWQAIESPDFAAAVGDLLPEVIEKRELNGMLPLDVLQNRFSSTLVAGEQQSWGARFFGSLKSGGPVMLPLAIIVIWGMVLIINRLRAYAQEHRRENAFINKAIELLEKNSLDDVNSLAKSGRSALARILNKCLQNSQWSRPAAEKAVREQLLAEMPRLDRYLNTLAVLAAAAPLLGLLGTVTGMISMFEAITKFGTADPRLLAGGISEALITTQAGLAIAIPLLLLHNYLRNRRNDIQADMEMYSMRILNRLYPKD